MKQTAVASPISKDQFWMAAMAVMAVYFIFMPTEAAAAAKSVSEVYNAIKNGITSTYGALFSIICGAIGLMEFALFSRQMSHLVGFIVVAIAPHLMVAAVEFFFGSI